MLGGTIDQTTPREPYPTLTIIRMASATLLSSSGCTPLLETVGTMAGAQEQSTHNPVYDYSTLETADASHFRHSTLEPVPAYQKEAYQTIDATDTADGRASGGFMNRRICGMRMKWALIGIIILLLFIVGAVVGAVMGSQKKSQGTPTPDSTPNANPITTSSTSSTTSTTTVSSTTSSSTLPPYTPLPSKDGFFAPDIIYNFSNSNLTTDGKQSFIQASYDSDTSSGSLDVARYYTKDEVPLLEWQIRPVYTSWRNSTFEHNVDESKDGQLDRSRTYWISSRHFGPDVRLTLDDERAFGLTNSSTEAGIEDYRLQLGLRPKDLANLGQYWYFIRKTPKGSNPRTTQYYTIHNALLPREWTVCKTFEKSPVMMSKAFKGEPWEQWDVIDGDELPKVDGKWSWVTDVEEGPGSE